jgi:CheY-like chemotaxis protein
VQPAESILLVDDHALLRESLAAAFRAAGMFSEVFEAQDGAEAVRVAEVLQPTLILLDVALPDGSGFEVLPRLKSVAPAVTQTLLQDALGALQLLENELYSPAVDLLSLGGALQQRWRAFARTPLTLQLSEAEEKVLGTFDKDRAFPIYFLADTLGQLAAQLPEGLLVGKLRLAKKGRTAVLHCTLSGAGSAANLLTLPPLQTALARLVIVGGRFKISPRRFTALLKP